MKPIESTEVKVNKNYMDIYIVVVQIYYRRNRYIHVIYSSCYVWYSGCFCCFSCISYRWNTYTGIYMLE